MQRFVDVMIVLCVSGAMLACVMGAVDCREIVGRKCDTERHVSCQLLGVNECGETLCRTVRCTRPQTDTHWKGRATPGLNGNFGNTTDSTDLLDNCDNAEVWIGDFGQTSECHWLSQESRCTCTKPLVGGWHPSTVQTEQAACASVRILIVPNCP
jgi:hypothetical protein